MARKIEDLKNYIQAGERNGSVVLTGEIERRYKNGEPRICVEARCDCGETWWIAKSDFKKIKTCKKCKYPTKMTREEINTANRETYYALKKMGICVNCQSRPARKGKNLCPECAERVSDAEIARREKMPAEKAEAIRAKERARHKARRKRDLEAGMCTRCGKRKPDAGHKWCRYCLHDAEKRRNRERSERGDVRRSERHEYGLCYICGAPVNAGGKACDRCVETARRNIAIGRSKVDKENHCWRRDERTIFTKNQGENYGKITGGGNADGAGQDRSGDLESPGRDRRPA